MVKKLVFFLLWTALATALMYFLQLNNSPTLTRMFLVVNFLTVVAALIHGTLIATLVGFFAPVSGFLATGILQMNFLMATIFESVTIGFLTGFFYKKFKNLYLTILLDFVVAKAVFIVAVYFLKTGAKPWVDLLYGLIGLGLQLIFIPVIHKILVKSSKIEEQKGGI